MFAANSEMMIPLPSAISRSNLDLIKQDSGPTSTPNVSGMSEMIGRPGESAAMAMPMPLGAAHPVAMSMPDFHLGQTAMISYPGSSTHSLDEHAAAAFNDARHLSQGHSQQSHQVHAQQHHAQSQHQQSTSQGYQAANHNSPEFFQGQILHFMGSAPTSQGLYASSPQLNTAQGHGHHYNAHYAPALAGPQYHGATDQPIYANYMENLYMNQAMSTFPMGSPALKPSASMISVPSLMGSRRSSFSSATGPLRRSKAPRDVRTKSSVVLLTDETDASLLDPSMSSQPHLPKRGRPSKRNGNYAASEAGNDGSGGPGTPHMAPNNAAGSDNDASASGSTSPVTGTASPALLAHTAAMVAEQMDRVVPVLDPTTRRATYTCPSVDCGRTFTRLQNLRSHLACHSEARPFACGACRARFRRTTDLARHARRHSGARPFQCAGCGHSFARRDALKKHAETLRGCRPKAMRKGSIGSAAAAGDSLSSSMSSLHDEMDESHRHHAHSGSALHHYAQQTHHHTHELQNDHGYGYDREEMDAFPPHMSRELSDHHDAIALHASQMEHGGYDHDGTIAVMGPGAVGGMPPVASSQATVTSYMMPEHALLTPLATPQNLPITKTLTPMPTMSELAALTVPGDNAGLSGEEHLDSFFSEPFPLV